MIGFSPKVHHAIAFAAKHHEGQRRKSRNVEYIVHPFEVALLLARYGRPEPEIVASLIHDVIEDCCETNADVAIMIEKIRTKFGQHVLEIVLGVTEQKRDKDDVKIDTSVRRKVYLINLLDAPEGSHWVCAADKVANGNDVLTALMHAKDREAVWGTFYGGKSTVIQWYRDVHSRLAKIGFKGEIMEELDNVASRLESAAITHEADLPKSR